MQHTHARWRHWSAGRTAGAQPLQRLGVWVSASTAMRMLQALAQGLAWASASQR